MPTLSADNLDAAIAQEVLFQDIRVYHYWDNEQALGHLISRTLKLTTPIAWDIYLLYPPGAKWKGDKLSAPDFWMHQLDERPDLLLDPDRLKTEVQKAIHATPKGEIFNDRLLLST